MRNIVVIFYSLILFSILSCDSFVDDKYLPILEKFENEVYILKKNIVFDDKILKKGKKIKIIITPGDDWIKVYGYKADVSLLKSERRLLIYMFEEEFKDKKFDLEVFKSKLFEFVKQKK